MFDHVGLKVRDLRVATEFYRAALQPLGHTLQSSGDGFAGFGPEGAPALWLYQHDKPIDAGTHLAFRAPDRTAVQRFHVPALAAGGRDNGAPGVRADYSADYYAAFVIDPDGHNIEVVCFA